jgi:exodeoxyribonuclease V alpha subunit
MENHIEVKAVVTKELYYSDMFGVYSFRPVYSSEEIKVNKTYGNFVVNGTCPQMIEGREYEFTIIPSKSKKYGDGYSFVEVQERKLNTVEEQQEYLRQVISTRDANIIIEAYPNEMIVDFIKAGKVDMNQTKGIKEGKMTYIQNKLSMYENLQVALVELKDLEISMNALKRLIDHFGSQDTLIEKIKENIYILTEIDMFSFKRIDEYAMKRGDKKDSPYRIKACFEHIVKENANDGNSWIDVERLISRSEDLLDIRSESILDVLHQIKEEPEKFYYDGKLFSLKKYFNYEKGIKRHLDRLMNTYETTNEDIESLIIEIEEETGLTFTDEQRDAIRISKKNGVFVMNGKAGSGKTFTLQGIIKVHKDISYMTCALSGKASSVLSSRGLNASTIHRMLGVSGRGQFYFNEEEKLPYDLVIIDESSMANAQLFYSVLQAIKDGGKVILVGDNMQLASIGVGAVFDDLLVTNHYPSKELTKVHRQAQKSGILMEANKVREGEKINERYKFNTQVYGELKDFVLIPLQNRESIFQSIIDISEGFLNKYGESWFHEFQILTALKQRGENSVKNLNIELQKIFNDIEKDYLERGSYQYRESDKVIHGGNNYAATILPNKETYNKIKNLNIEAMEEVELAEYGVKIGSVFNGTIGKIVHIDFLEKKALIEFEDIEGVVLYDQQQLSMIELAYAITIHRSQGIGVKNILATFDFVAFKMLSKQLVYTAMTRAAEKLVVICENAALHKAIETDHGSTRDTFLKLMIRGEV